MKYLRTNNMNNILKSDRKSYLTIQRRRKRKFFFFFCCNSQNYKIYTTHPTKKKNRFFKFCNPKENKK